jgi:hypothetical protein
MDLSAASTKDLQHESPISRLVRWVMIVEAESQLRDFLISSLIYKGAANVLFAQRWMSYHTSKVAGLYAARRQSSWTMAL